MTSESDTLGPTREEQKSSESPRKGGRTIVLVGLMGAGKSSVGKRLAKTMGLPFRDADHEIETASNLTIQEFFDQHGEAAFRKGERKVISRLLAGPQHILATGGGAFMDPETRKLIRENGRSVWLHADLDILLKRCLKRDTRPLLKTGEPRKILEDLIAVRYPVYSEADITVESGDGPHEIVVKKIIDALSDFS
ncbi:shikimate kinase [Sneathiella chinensis]|uniref:Shikimate kinase n=1 Tax=Sneathiella chinensis TaxID=349750 RepID=A0ABQ5U089_9PROT|nr:shikimate kinase [Sneathiella chinensis]GLQ05627.1 shikimate kinase [Sneathiella chinensis]